MRESAVETYLDEQVLKAGGVTRKFSSDYRPNNPDRIVIWPAPTKYTAAAVVFVECKAPGKKARPGQRRELNRLKKLGCTALVCDSKAWVDLFVKQWSNK